MTFIIGHEEPGSRAAAFHAVEQLARFAVWHAWVILANDSEYRFCDLLPIIERGDALKVSAHLRVALITILDATQIAAIRLGMLEQRHQVGNPDHWKRAGDAIVVERGDGISHVPAVASARDHDLGGIERGLLSNPVKQRADVFVSVVAMEAVIELQESLAVAGRAAHVR